MKFNLKASHCLWMILLLGGCICGKKNHESSITPGKEFTLVEGKSASLKSKNLVLTFDEVSEDSRCPLYTDCIWEGQAVIKMEVQKGKEKTSIEFTRKGKESTPIKQSVGEYEIQLIKIEPYPESGKPIKKGSYSVKMIIN